MKKILTKYIIISLSLVSILYSYDTYTPLNYLMGNDQLICIINKGDSYTCGSNINNVYYKSLYNKVIDTVHIIFKNNEKLESINKYYDKDKWLFKKNSIYSNDDAFYSIKNVSYLNFYKKIKINQEIFIDNNIIVFQNYIKNQSELEQTIKLCFIIKFNQNTIIKKKTNNYILFQSDDIFTGIKIINTKINCYKVDYQNIINNGIINKTKIGNCYCIEYNVNVKNYASIKHLQMVYLNNNDNDIIEKLSDKNVYMSDRVATSNKYNNYADSIILLNSLYNGNLRQELRRSIYILSNEFIDRNLPILLKRDKMLLYKLVLLDFKTYNYLRLKKIYGVLHNSKNYIDKSISNIIFYHLYFRGIFKEKEITDFIDNIMNYLKIQNMRMSYSEKRIARLSNLYIYRLFLLWEAKTIRKKAYLNYRDYKNDIKSNYQIDDSTILLDKYGDYKLGFYSVVLEEDNDILLMSTNIYNISKEKNNVYEPFTGIYNTLFGYSELFSKIYIANKYKNRIKNNGIYSKLNLVLDRTLQEIIGLGTANRFFGHDSLRFNYKYLYKSFKDFSNVIDTLYKRQYVDYNFRARKDIFIKEMIKYHSYSVKNIDDRQFIKLYAKNLSLLNNYLKNDIKKLKNSVVKKVLIEKIEQLDFYIRKAIGYFIVIDFIPYDPMSYIYTNFKYKMDFVVRNYSIVDMNDINVNLTYPDNIKLQNINIDNDKQIQKGDYGIVKLDFIADKMDETIERFSIFKFDVSYLMNKYRIRFIREFYIPVYFVNAFNISYNRKNGIIVVKNHSSYPIKKIKWNIPGDIIPEKMKVTETENVYKINNNRFKNQKYKINTIIYTSFKSINVEWTINN